MKLLFVIDNLGSGGVQKLLVNLSIELASRGSQITVFCYSHESEYFLSSLAHENITLVLRKKSGLGFQFGVLLHLIKLKPSSFDAVFSFQPGANIYCSSLFVLAPFTKRIFGEFSLSTVGSMGAKRRLANIANRFADTVICNSVSQQNYIVRNSPPTLKSRVVRNGIDPDQFKFKDRRHGDLKVISVVARVSVPKNGVNFVKGLLLYLERNGNIPKINWVGRQDDDLGSIQMRQEMEGLIRTNESLLENWTWCGETQDVLSVYYASDVIMLPSRLEGLPNVLCEAMFAGCPIIASNVSDIPELLRNGKRGLLFNPEIPLSICKSIEKFQLLDQGVRKSMVTESLQYASEYLTVKRMADEYMDAVLAEVSCSSHRSS